MTTSNKSRIAFWLLPAEDDTERLKQMIELFAAQLGTPAFTPHLTLLARPAEEFTNPKATLEQLAACTSPFHLAGSGVPQWGPLYNQAFVLPFPVSPELTLLVEKLHPRRIVPEDYFPHISLIYANLTPELGKQLVQEYTPDNSPVRFDQVAAIRIGPECSCDDDVRSWETIATVQLKQKES